MIALACVYQEIHSLESMTARQVRESRTFSAKVAGKCPLACETDNVLTTQRYNSNVVISDYQLTCFECEQFTSNASQLSLRFHQVTKSC